MSSRRYVTATPTDDGWLDWRELRPSMLLECCDCALVHEFQFDGDRWRVRRLQRPTGQRRRHKGIRVVHDAR